MQRLPTRRDDWIKYCTYDAESTFELCMKLREKLDLMAWKDTKSMLYFYEEYWRPFGELLTDMEREGVYIRHNTYFPEIERKARQDAKEFQKVHQIFKGLEFVLTCCFSDLPQMGSEKVSRSQIYEHVQREAETVFLLCAFHYVQGGTTGDKRI